MNEAFFPFGPDTELRRADGTAATAADLKVGRRLTLWITGPIMESLLGQVIARRVVLE